VRAFALDWYAGFNRYILSNPEEAARLTTEAEQAVTKAILLDETNALAQVFRAEIMIDQQRWDQAESAMNAALQREPNMWDAHRVRGLFLEYQGYYQESIEAFERAVELAPNMTFLYIKLGMSYRNMALNTAPPANKRLYETAIDKFAQAVDLNKQLGVEDPLPYLGIGRTYAQLGEFYISSLNMNTALQINPYNADVYAQLGMVYRQARNYEDAITALGCAVDGCSADVTCNLRGCDPELDPPIVIEGMELNGLTVVYYYTYASLLAGMYLPRDVRRSSYCDDSTRLIQEIRTSTYANEQIILDILAESEFICRTMTGRGANPADGGASPADGGASPAEGGANPAEGGATPAPGAPTATPTATPTPIRTPTLFPTPPPR
jgi:tetratricopeptide (TPR) repeat protein